VSSVNGQLYAGKKVELFCASDAGKSHALKFLLEWVDPISAVVIRDCYALDACVYEAGEPLSMSNSQK
jgi:TFIIF-interacting CTD phosphatase-like protein